MLSNRKNIPFFANALTLQSNKVHAQSASCGPAKQTCYKVISGGVTVKTVSDLLTVKLLTIFIRIY
jgi:hypothetical protein